MKQWYMMTVIGADRAGIVARLTKALYAGRCHLGEASMVRLGGNFTIMLMVQSELDLQGLRDLVQPIAADMRLHVHLDAIDAHLHQHLEPNVQVQVFGADRAGIVADVTGALAAAGFNILDLNSDIAGTADRPIYVMMIDGFCERGIDQLEDALAPLRASGIDVHLSPIDTLIG